MKDEVKWTEVVNDRLSGYEINTVGTIRTTKYKRTVPLSFDSKNKRSVMLTCINGDRELFYIRDLLYQTLKITNKPYIDDNAPKIEFMVKPEQFSEDEEDYGRGAHKIHWEEIRELGKKATHNKNQSKK